MKTRIYATTIGCRQITLATISIMLLLSGCERLLQTYKPVESTDANPTESLLSEGDNKDYAEAREQSAGETFISEGEYTVVATIENEHLTLSKNQLPGGKVQVQVNNLDTETLDVLILQTDLPMEYIPIKNGRVDFSTGTVKLTAQLDTSPLPILSSDTIFCSLEPGNYVVMAYPSGKIYNAMRQVITVNATGEI